MSRCISIASLSAPGDRDAQHMGRALALLGRHLELGDGRLQPSGQRVAQAAQPLAPRAACSGTASCGRPPERHGARDVLRARPEAVLLAAAVDDRLHGLTVAHDERANTLRRADLVAGDRESVQRPPRARPAPCRTPARHRCGRARPPSAPLGDLGHGLHYADLVVDPHHGDDGGTTGECGVERVEIGAPRASTGITTSRPPRWQTACAAARIALCSIAETTAHMAPPRARGERGAHDAEVVRLGSARGENHLVRLRAHRLRDFPPGLLDPRAGRAAEAVGARRIAEGLAAR